MEKYIVYITINLCNGKFYIGTHKTNPETFDGYIGCGIYRASQANEDYPFHRAVKKYGYDNFKRTTLRVFETQEEAYAFEAELVTQTLLRSKNCYNIQKGGYGGTGFTSKKVYQFALNGNFMKVWNSVKEASTTLNISHIDSVCRGERDSAGGFYWSYEKKFNYIPYNNCRAIAQYTPSGKFIRSWTSEKEAQIALNIVNIHRAIKMKILCGGYQWKDFSGDSSDIDPLVSKRGLREAFKSKIEQLDQSRSLVRVWNSLEELEANGFKKVYVRAVIKGNQNTYKGYIFRLQDSDIVLSSAEMQSSSLENVSSLTNQAENNDRKPFFVHRE